MSNNDTVYYIAAGRSLAAAEAWAQAMDRIQSARNAAADRMGATGLWGDDDSVYALAYDEGAPIPAGLRQVKRDTPRRIFVPNCRTQSGRELQRELESLRLPREFGGNLYIGPTDGGGRTTLSRPGIEKLGGRWVISQHVKAKPPDDAIPLKRSEFWAMAERQEAAKTIAEPVTA